MTADQIAGLSLFGVFPVFAVGVIVGAHIQRKVQRDAE